MKKVGVKLLILVLGLGGIGTAGYFVYETQKAFQTLPMADLSHEERMIIESSVGEKDSGHGAKSAAAGHGTSAGGHGGGHGAPAGGHGAASGGHGAPSGGHGDSGGGHGAPTASAPSGGLPLISFDELFVNVSSPQVTRSLALKLEIELFDESHRGMVDERQSAVKHTVLTAAREQDYFRLNTIAGKLYFKEVLVGRINQYFRQPVVKDVHFSSFFLQ